MKILIYSLLFFGILSGYYVKISAEDMSDKTENITKVVQPFIDAIKTNDAQKIAAYVKYPLFRKAPVNYKNNVYVFKTDAGIGRIDDISKDIYKNKFRYSFWNNDKKMSEKPDIVIFNGDVEYYGSANNHEYNFINGSYRYIFEVTYVGPMDMIPYVLRIYKDNKEIISYPAKIIK